MLMYIVMMRSLPARKNWRVLASIDASSNATQQDFDNSMSYHLL